MEIRNETIFDIRIPTVCAVTSEQLTRADLAADWESGVSSKGRWFARFASADQIAFGCDVPIGKARAYYRELDGSFTADLLAKFEADCERAG